jgi:hypothetical protein
MIISTVLDLSGLVLGRTEGPGLPTLYRADQLQLQVDQLQYATQALVHLPVFIRVHALRIIFTFQGCCGRTVMASDLVIV